jgi:hypothetical protein
MAAAHLLPLHLWILRRPDRTDDAAGMVRMTDLTGNDPDALTQARPDQVVDVPLIDLLDDTVDLTPGRHMVEPPRDFPAGYETARQELQRRLGELAACCRTCLPALGRWTARAFR